MDRCLGRGGQAVPSFAAGVLREWSCAACSGLLLGKIAFCRHHTDSVGVRVTCVFCTGLELNLVTQAMSATLYNPFFVVSLSPLSSLSKMG